MWLAIDWTAASWRKMDSAARGWPGAYSGANEAWERWYSSLAISDGSASLWPQGGIVQMGIARCVRCKSLLERQ